MAVAPVESLAYQLIITLKLLEALYTVVKTMPADDPQPSSNTQRKVVEPKASATAGASRGKAPEQSKRFTWDKYNIELANRSGWDMWVVLESRFDARSDAKELIDENNYVRVFDLKAPLQFSDKILAISFMRSIREPDVRTQNEKLWLDGIEIASRRNGFMLNTFTSVPLIDKKGQRYWAEFEKGPLPGWRKTFIVSFPENKLYGQKSSNLPIRIDLGFLGENLTDKSVETAIQQRVLIPTGRTGAYPFYDAKLDAAESTKYKQHRDQFAAELEYLERLAGRKPGDIVKAIRVAGGPHYAQAMSEGTVAVTTGTLDAGPEVYKRAGRHELAHLIFKELETSGKLTNLAKLSQQNLWSSELMAATSEQNFYVLKHKMGHPQRNMNEAFATYVNEVSEPDFNVWKKIIDSLDTAKRSVIGAYLTAISKDLSNSTFAGSDLHKRVAEGAAYINK